MAIALAILWLRRIASCFFFTLAILFAALWVRSYESGDTIWIIQQPRIALGKFELGDQFSVTHGEGLIVIRYVDTPCSSFDWSVSYVPRVSPWGGHSHTFGFGRLEDNLPSIEGYATGYVMPHWFVILVTALLAIAIRPAPRFKFSLRDLLTLTTVAALTIGPLAFWLRSIS